MGPAQGALRQALDEITKHVAAGDVTLSLAEIDALLDQAPVGLHLVEPWRVVLAGRPNVGKSSLINALVGYERAIVHATPGTTRDLVTAAAALDGWPVELTDTAGLHASDDALEQAGMSLARERLQRADLVVLVFDASSLWLAEDEALARQWPTALCVFNKCDLLRPDDRNDVRPGRRTSAVSGQGIEELGRDISERLVSEPPSAGPGRALSAETGRRVDRTAPRGRVGPVGGSRRTAGAAGELGRHGLLAGGLGLGAPPRCRHTLPPCSGANAQLWQMPAAQTRNRGTCVVAVG